MKVEGVGVPAISVSGDNRNQSNAAQIAGIDEIRR
jgi:hypothetical protein